MVLLFEDSFTGRLSSIEETEVYIGPPKIVIIQNFH